MVTSAQDTFKAVISSVGSAVSGGTASSAKPVITGTAPVGGTVNIYDGVRLLGTATVGADGKWSFTPTADLKVGSHQFTAIAVDASGSFGASSTPLSVTVPSSTPVAPAKPIISGMTDDQGHPLGNPTNDPHPSMSGTGTPGDTITMYDGPTAIGSTTVKPDGTWTVEPTKDLSSGTHDIYVIETNPAGTPSTPSDHTAVVVDTSVPATPAAPVMTDDASASIPSGGKTTDAHPNISGTGTAGDIIKLYDGSKVIGSVKIGADGKWTIKPTTDLSTGMHDLYVTDTNPAGTASAASPHISLNVVPVAPVITSLVDAVGPVTGNVPSGGTTDDKNFTVKGTGIPGDTVYLFKGSNGCGDTVVDASGNWSIKLVNPLSDGAYNMTATQFSSGQTGSQSAASNTWTITVDTTTPAKPVIGGMTDDSGAAISAGSTTADAHPNINGTGKAGDLIKLYDGSTLIGSATVGADGKWSVKPATDLSNGKHDLSATETNLAGVTGASSDHISVTINAGAPATPAAPVMTDDSGAVIPAGSTTGDLHPNFNGTGTAGDIVTLYDGSTAIGSVTIGADGKWVITPTTDLSGGSHDLYVIETNDAGTPSAQSPHTTVVIDPSLVPATPAMPTLSDDNGKTIAPGSNTADAHPNISGHGTTGDTVTVYDGSKAIGSVAITSADGTWTFKPATDLSTGSHDIYVKETSPAGGTSAPSDHVTFSTTDGSRPAPTITAYVDHTGLIQGNVPSGGTTDQATWILTGTGVPGANLYIYVDRSPAWADSMQGDSMGEVVQADGTWTVTGSGLAPGLHSFYVRQWDFANPDVYSSRWDSPSSETFTITIDTTPVATPVVTSVTDHNGTAIATGGATADTHVIVNGTGKAGDLIMLYDGTKAVGSVTIGGDGKWSVSPATDLTDGAHDLSVRESNALGTQSVVSAHTTFGVYTGTPATPATPVMTDDVGGIILAGSTTTDAHPNFSGTGTAGDIIKLYDGSTVIGSVKIGADGKWKLATTDLSSGTHDLYVTESNPAGTASGASTHITLVVPPVTSKTSLTINDALLDHNGDAIVWTDGPVGRLTTETLPIVTGTGIAGDVIKVYVNYYGSLSLAGSTVADGSGHWSLALTKALSQDLGDVTRFIVTQTGPGLADSPQVAGGWFGVSVGLHATLAAPVVTDNSDDTAVHDTSGIHTAVGNNDTFVGHSATGNETVDLNVDPSSYFKQATAHIEGAKGGAIDTLHLTGDHQVLDLTSLTGQTAAAKISGIEVIDLGGHANNLKVSLLDVLNLGEADLFQQDGKQQMMVKGAAGDSVDLSNTHIAGVADGQWEQHGTTQVGGVTYNVYEHSGAHTELLVQQGVQIIVH